MCAGVVPGDGTQSIFGGALRIAGSRKSVNLAVFSVPICDPTLSSLCLISCQSPEHVISARAGDIRAQACHRPRSTP